LEPSVAAAIDRGLALAYSERPQDVGEFRGLLNEIQDHPQLTTLQILDDQLDRLHKFKHNKRGCPACGGLLVEAKPLRRGACPVCLDGAIRKLDITDRSCPACRTGVLHARKNEWPNLTCPACAKAVLEPRPAGLLSKLVSGARCGLSECPRCQAKFEADADKITLVEDPAHPDRVGQSGSAEAWRERAGRSLDYRLCDVCGAQFDALRDGRLRLSASTSKLNFDALYPEEWARVAAGLKPEGGNAECQPCGAEFFLESDRITVLSAPHDPNGFFADYGRRLLSLETAKWLAVGKESPHPGFVCEACPTEFDSDGVYLRLVRTNHPKLGAFTGKPKTPEDWRRLALGLPGVADEGIFLASFEPALERPIAMARSASTTRTRFSGKGLRLATAKTPPWSRRKTKSPSAALSANGAPQSTRSNHAREATLRCRSTSAGPPIPICSKFKK
jgi:hypothetical protein